MVHSQSAPGGAPLGRLAVTLSAIVAVLGAGRIPLPGVDGLALAEFGGAPLGLLALGLGPFASSFVVVELVALAVPPWRRLRVGGPAGRRPLALASVGLGLVFAVLQAYGIARFLGSSRLLWEEPLAFGLVMVSLVGGSAAVLAVAAWIGRRGLGDGFAILFSAQTLAAVVGAVRAGAGAMPALSLLLAAVPIAWVLFAVVRALLANDALRAAVEPILRHPASGVIPIGMAAALLAIPATLSGFFPSLLPAAVAVRAGTDPYFALLAIGVVALAFLFARLFHAPGAVAAVWCRLPGSPPPDDLRASLPPLLRRASIRSATLLVLLALIPLVLRYLSVAVPAALSLAGLALALAAVADLRAEWRARRDGAELVPVWPEHRVFAADAALAALRGAGIEPFARSIHYRTLTRFFAPYSPIVLFVPAAQAAEAEALLQRVLGAPAA